MELLRLNKIVIYAYVSPLEAGADINIKKDPYGTVLHIAANNNCDQELIDFLYSKQPALLTIKDRFGATAFHIATANSIKCMHALWSIYKAQGHNMMELVNLSDNNGFTPLHYSPLVILILMLNICCYLALI